MVGVLLKMLSRLRDVLRVSISCVLLTSCCCSGSDSSSELFVVKYFVVGSTLFVFYFFNLICFILVVCVNTNGMTSIFY